MCDYRDDAVLVAGTRSALVALEEQSTNESSNLRRLLPEYRPVERIARSNWEAVQWVELPGVGLDGLPDVQVWPADERAGAMGTSAALRAVAAHNGLDLAAEPAFTFSTDSWARGGQGPFNFQVDPGLLQLAQKRAMQTLYARGWSRIALFDSGFSLPDVSNRGHNEWDFVAIPMQPQRLQAVDTVGHGSVNNNLIDIVNPQAAVSNFRVFDHQHTGAEVALQASIVALWDTGCFGAFDQFVMPFSAGGVCGSTMGQTLEWVLNHHRQTVHGLAPQLPGLVAAIPNVGTSLTYPSLCANAERIGCLDWNDYPTDCGYTTGVVRVYGGTNNKPLASTPAGATFYGTSMATALAAGALSLP